MREARTRVIFDVMDKQAVTVVLRTNFIDMFIKSIHPAVKRIVPHHCLPVPIVIVLEVKSAAEK